MFQLYTPVRSAAVWRRLALAALLATGVSASSAVAQSLNYTGAASTNVAGTYTDLGTTGTVISTTTLDDSNSAAQPIGFTFGYNGQTFTQFTLNTNGWLKLGATPASNAVGSWEDISTDLFSSSDPADNNILSAFGADLVGTAAAGTEYRVATSGTAPNRVCTIQWKNVSDYPYSSATTQYTGFSFQVKLYETTNNIEFVYGPSTPGTGAAANKGANVGLKGSGINTGQVLLVNKVPTATWATTNFLNTVYSSNQAFGYTRTATADPGRTFRFTAGQTLANDAEVQAIYSLSKLPRTAGSPHTVQALIRNTGSNAQTGVAVRLTVSGATTYTNTKQITSIPVGGAVTVSFDPYTAAALGTNTLRVELVLGDEDASNDVKTYTQEVTDNVYSYATNGPSTTSLGIPATPTLVPSGAFVSKFTTSGARTVTAANIRLEASSTNPSVGRTVFAVVMDANGNLLGRTPDYTIVAADAGTAKTFTFPTPVAVAAGTFYVGLAQLNPAGTTTSAFPLGVQAETPTRTDAFYVAAPLNTTGANSLQDLAAQNFGVFMIDAVLNTTTGVSKAMDNAVSLYPNPSNGKFTLAINGVGAASTLKVEVTNSLGQRVYTGTARDNFSNQLDLSGLANGMYTLKVQSGDQYMVRNLSVQK